MSRHHGYLTFVGGRHLSRPLSSALEFSAQWRANLTAVNTRLYAVPSPPQVASAFVLQHLLSIPAQVSAFAAVTGPWHADLGTLDDSRISCDLAPGLYPERLGFLSLRPAAPELEERIAAAGTAYRALGREIAQAYDGGVKVSTRQRLGMVDDLWQMALREARGAAGQGLGPAVERRSCCFIYALPGCHECAGCPRLSDTTLGPRDE
ncbi:(2Fe-2S)-binding protein [Knoellia sp. S7-12]|uniref:(2Fe-2S)-binding protein n=1 Tax=Knoellia sp. S7-12 TaxID=3126698 RepID=UPI00336692FB